MDFNHAVIIINNLLIKKRPDTLNSSWILKHAPHVYRYIQKNVRADIGGIDWDKITRVIDHRFQKKWKPSYRNGRKLYRRKGEVGIVLQKYQSKLYVFIAPADKNDEHVRDVISIALVRIAQKGNLINRAKPPMK